MSVQTLFRSSARFVGFFSGDALTASIQFLCITSIFVDKSTFLPLSQVAYGRKALELISSQTGALPVSKSRRSRRIMHFNKKISFLALFIFSTVIAALFVFSSASGGQETQRTECDKACRKAYNDCRQAAGANQAECRKGYEGCRDACKAPTPSPEPTVDPTPMKPSPTVSPSPEPMPSPTVSPSPEPMPNPTASPSPEMTPSPTVSPSPEMTPTPSPRS